MNQHSPYVGISGVVTAAQARGLVATAQAAGLINKRRLLLGVKAVHKTQYLDVPNKYGTDWYPVGPEPFAAALPAGELSPRTVVAAAQVYLDVDHVGDADYRESFTKQILSRGQGWLSAIQFDLLPWHTNRRPIADFLAGLRRRHPDLEVLLQCHRPAMDLLGPQGAARALATLAEHVDHVLYDSSHGTGQRMDTAALTPFLEAFHENGQLGSVGCGIAGGLDAETVREHLPVLLDRFPDLSWDAEGRLHPGEGTARPLSMTAATSYLTASAHLL